MEARKPHDRFELHFTQVNAGWLRYQLNMGWHESKERMSEVFDPLPHLKRWLEALCTGVQEAAFGYDDEGCLISFRFSETHHHFWEREKDAPAFWFKKVCYEHEEQMSAYLSRVQVIDAFYNSLFRFAASEKWQADQWERTTLGQAFTELTGYTEETVLK